MEATSSVNETKLSDKIICSIPVILYNLWVCDAFDQPNSWLVDLSYWEIVFLFFQSIILFSTLWFISCIPKYKSKSSLVAKELEFLPKILVPNEKVLTACEGFDGFSTVLLAVTNKRVIYTDSGLLGGNKTISISIDKITSVLFKRGFMNFISIKHGSGIGTELVIPYQKDFDEFQMEFQKTLYKESA